MPLHCLCRFKSALYASAALLLVLLPSVSAFAATYYVSPAGKAQNDGLSVATSFGDLQTAANHTQPGDTVLVMNGTYSGDPKLWHQAVLVIATSGTARLPITYAAYPGHHPVIATANNPKVWDAVQITGSYINFTGFEVVGSAQNITLDQATAIFQQEELNFTQSQAAHALNPAAAIVYPNNIAANSQCIAIEGATHVMIKKNVVHDCSASGIVSEQSDYVAILSNVVFNTSWWTSYDTSGINIHGMRNSDRYTGYKNTVINNISHDNGNTQPFYDVANGNLVPTDGNGIIIDSNQLTNDGQPYVGRTLVMSNIVYNNGGSGIHAFQSKHVDMFNNTAYMNNKCPVPGSACGDINDGQIFAASSDDVKIYNNIMYSPAGKAAYSNWLNSAISEGYNILYSLDGHVSAKGYIPARTDIITDPLIARPSIASAFSALPLADTLEAASPTHASWDLKPLKASPARNAGTTVLANGAIINPVAMDGNQGARIGIGAISAPSAQ